MQFCLFRCNMLQRKFYSKCIITTCLHNSTANRVQFSRKTIIDVIRSAASAVGDNRQKSTMTPLPSAKTKTECRPYMRPSDHNLPILPCQRKTLYDYLRVAKIPQMKHVFRQNLCIFFLMIFRYLRLNCEENSLKNRKTNISNRTYPSKNWQQNLCFKIPQT